jgi:hypothetical protein
MVREDNLLKKTFFLIFIVSEKYLKFYKNGKRLREIVNRAKNYLVG